MADQENHMLEKWLFGGAILSHLPHNCIDASTIREVPDHQEVFCHKESDQSIIFDILEYQKQVQGEEAPRYHFSDIAEANETVGEVTLAEPIPKDEISIQECKEAWYLHGIQKVAKFNEEVGNVVQIHLGLFRLPDFGTDLVITMNNPTQISTQSSSSQQTNHNQLWTENSFKNIISNLKIIDTQLFA